MPLDILLEVLTEDECMSIGKIVTSLFGTELAVPKWGFQYKRYEATADPLSGRASLKTVRVKGEYVFEGVESKKLYVVKAGGNEFGDPPSYTISEDTRYKLFGSREIYKSFFYLLNAAKKEGFIDDDAYIAAVNFIGRMNNRVLPRLKKLFLGEDRVKRQLQKDIENHPVIGHYFAEAKRQQLK